VLTVLHTELQTAGIIA